MRSVPRLPAIVGIEILTIRVAVPEKKVPKRAVARSKWLTRGFTLHSFQVNFRINNAESDVEQTKPGALKRFRGSIYSDRLDGARMTLHFPFSVHRYSVERFKQNEIFGSKSRWQFLTESLEFNSLPI
jgi:hypothetical protein